MRTDDLIRGLAADVRPTRGLGAGLAGALAAGLAGALVLFALILTPRAGMPGLLADPRVLLKFAVSLSLAAAASLTALRLVRPGAAAGRAARLLAVPALLLAAGVAGELLARPSSDWMPDLVGHSAFYCTVLVPLISAPLLGAALLALRRGAPSSPALAGAAAGLLAGGIGAALYALHCGDDSPLFLLVWYGIAITAVTGAGALIGRRVLAW
ncbi:NrsF family protein [Ancylobacter terrae]|uniref:NrsF family protein n=1 Tax=Ancylobacter sp. sgz301288 TaxID=3342077 RepID=UPI00385E0D99